MKFVIGVVVVVLVAVAEAQYFLGAGYAAPYWRKSKKILDIDNDKYDFVNEKGDQCVCMAAGGAVVTPGGNPGGMIGIYPGGKPGGNPGINIPGNTECGPSPAEKVDIGNVLVEPRVEPAQRKMRSFYSSSSRTHYL